MALEWSAEINFLASLWWLNFLWGFPCSFYSGLHAKLKRNSPQKRNKYKPKDVLARMRSFIAMWLQRSSIHLCYSCCHLYNFFHSTTVISNKQWHVLKTKHLPPPPKKKELLGAVLNCMLCQSVGTYKSMAKSRTSCVCELTLGIFTDERQQLKIQRRPNSCHSPMSMIATIPREGNRIANVWELLGPFVCWVIDHKS